MAVGVVAVELGILVSRAAARRAGPRRFVGRGRWPARRAGLASRLVQFVADGHERASNGESRGVEVDVTPSQAEDLAASHSGVGGDPQRGEETVIACRRQECSELLGVPHPRRVAREWPSLRGVGDLGRVAEDQDRGGRRRRALDAGSCGSRRRSCCSVHPFLDLSLVGAWRRDARGGPAEVPERDPSDVGYEVQLDVAAVGAQVLGRRVSCLAGNHR